MKKLCSLGPFLLMAVLMGCAVTDDQIEKAREVCKSHGGISILWGKITNSAVDVQCNDKTYIETKINK